MVYTDVLAALIWVPPCQVSPSLADLSFSPVPQNCCTQRIYFQRGAAKHLFGCTGLHYLSGEKGNQREDCEGHKFTHQLMRQRLFILHCWKLSLLLAPCP